MTFKYRYRKQITIGVSIAILMISITAIILYNYPKNTLAKEKKEKIITKKQVKESKGTKEEILYQVDIKGQVQNPGIYKLKKDSRVYEVIEQAGGLTNDANTTVINLSKKISDEMVIIIYSNEEVKNFENTKKLEEQVINQCQQKDENALKNDACITQEQPTSIQTKISLNEATTEELMSLPGIGEKKANDIIEYRNKNGKYKSIEEIMNVSGIGESVFEKIKDYITVE